jgi:hypothetical protein
MTIPVQTPYYVVLHILAPKELKVWLILSSWTAYCWVLHLHQIWGARKDHETRRAKHSEKLLDDTIESCASISCSYTKDRQMKRTLSQFWTSSRLKYGRVSKGLFHFSIMIWIFFIRFFCPCKVDSWLYLFPLRNQWIAFVPWLSFSNPDTSAIESGVLVLKHSTPFLVTSGTSASGSE